MFSFSVNTQKTTKSSVTQVQHAHTVSVQSAHPYWVYWSFKTQNTWHSFYDMKTDTEPVQIWVWYTAVIWNKYDTNNTNLLLFQICITLTKKWCLHPDFSPVFRQSSTRILLFTNDGLLLSENVNVSVMHKCAFSFPFSPSCAHTHTHTHTHITRAHSPSQLQWKICTEVLYSLCTKNSHKNTTKPTQLKLFQFANNTLHSTQNLGTATRKRKQTSGMYDLPFKLQPKLAHQLMRVCGS